MRYITTVDGIEFKIEILDDQRIKINGKVHLVDFISVANQSVYSLIMDGNSHEAYVYPGEEDLQVLIQGRSYSITVEDEREKQLRTVGGTTLYETSEYILRSPMPGLVISLPVSEGQEVQKGDVLVILESMKMQNELKSPRDGVLVRLKIRPGDNVEQRQVLLSVE